MLDRYQPFVLFEMPEFGGGGGGGDEFSVAIPAPAPVAAPEPTAVAPAAPAPGEPPTVVDPPAPAAPATFTQDELEQELEARMAPLMQYMPLMEALMEAANNPGALGAPAAPGAPEGLEIDFLADNAGEQLQQLFANERNQTLQAMQQILGQALAPITGRFEAEALGEGDQRALDIISDDIVQHGEILDESKQLARQLSEVMFGEYANRYGATPRAAEAALRKATSTVRAIEQAAGQAAVERYKNQLAELGGAPQVPGVPAAGVVTVPQGGDEMSVARRYTGLAIG